MSISKDALEFLVRSFTRTYASLTKPRVLTTGLTQVEIAIIEGDFFIAHSDFTIPSGESHYIKFTAPPQGVTFALSQRELTPDVAGIQYRIRKDFSGGTLSGTNFSIFNENSYFQDIKTSGATFDYYTVAPSGLGVIIDMAWIPPTAQGPRITGSVNPESGFKIIKYDSELLIEIKNTSGVSNDVLLKYGWAEVPSEFT